MVAPDHSYDVEKIRRREGLIFGKVAGKSSEISSKSQIRLWISESSKAATSVGRPAVAWDAGVISRFESEWEKKVGGGRGIDGTSYLGYGAFSKPLELSTNRSALGPVLPAEVNRSSRTSPHMWDAQVVQFNIAFSRNLSEGDRDSLFNALAVMSEFGSVGSRAKNGFGSFTLFDPALRQPLTVDAPVFKKICRGVSEGINDMWPNSIATDVNGPQIWEFKSSFRYWNEAFYQYATLKKSLYASDVVRDRQLDAGRAQYRDLLAMAGNSVLGSRRWPTQLAFKLKLENEPNVARGMIYHVAASPTKTPISNQVEAQVRAWGEIAAFLDQQPHLERNNKSGGGQNAR